MGVRNNEMTFLKVSRGRERGKEKLLTKKYILNENEIKVFI